MVGETTPSNRPLTAWPWSRAEGTCPNPVGILTARGKPLAGVDFRAADLQSRPPLVGRPQSLLRLCCGVWALKHHDGTACLVTKWDCALRSVRPAKFEADGQEKSEDRLIRALGIISDECSTWVVPGLASSITDKPHIITSGHSGRAGLTRLGGAWPGCQVFSGRTGAWRNTRGGQARM